MRASKLDELPQLYNVLTGDMSIVGPRPLLSIDQPATPSRRLAVLPGLTGWAQVNGGNLISPEEKNELDEWYIDNASVRLDLYILLLTIRAIIYGDCRNESVFTLPFGCSNQGRVAAVTGGLSDHDKLAQIRPE